MLNLDDLSIIKNLDKGNAAASIEMLPRQIESAWASVSALSLDPKYSTAKNIIIAGMGGSAYGARILQSVYSKELTIPLVLANGYHLPGFVSPDSLVFLCSYSGSTEETLSCADEAQTKTELISGVTSGGALGDLLKAYPSYIFNTRFNPSSQPRIGVGYMVVGLLVLITQMGYITLNEKEIKSTVALLDQKGPALSPSSPSNENEIKRLALLLHEKIPVLIVADFLEGAAHAIRNPLHETGKQFGLYFTVPELNHHLMEGLKYPEDAKNYLHFVFFDSSLYEARIQKRMALTRSVVEKNGIKTSNISLSGTTPFAQTMELIQLGGWLSFYLAILNGIDPSPVPWVDYFKKELNKQ